MTLLPELNTNLKKLTHPGFELKPIYMNDSLISLSLKGSSDLMHEAKDFIVGELQRKSQENEKDLEEVVITEHAEILW